MDNSENKPSLFVSVIEDHKGIIYKIANSYCSNEEDRKDLIQEIMIQIWQSFGNYDNQYKYSTWIYRIALNVAISFYRKEKRRQVFANPVSEDMFHFVDDELSEKDNNIRYLQQFISELKELDRALIILYLDEKSHKEIAEIMGLSETNIATKINRIKEKLRKRFSQLKD